MFPLIIGVARSVYQLCKIRNLCLIGALSTNPTIQDKVGTTLGLTDYQSFEWLQEVGSFLWRSNSKKDTFRNKAQGALIDNGTSLLDQSRKEEFEAERVKEEEEVKELQKQLEETPFWSANRRAIRRKIKQKEARIRQLNRRIAGIEDSVARTAIITQNGARGWEMIKLLFEKSDAAARKKIKNEQESL